MGRGSGGAGASARWPLLPVALAVAVALGGCQRSPEAPAQAGGDPAPSSAAPATAAPSTTAPPSTRRVPPAPTRPQPPAKLRQGMKGPEVAALQRRLAGLGYEVVEADGVFASTTRHAVVAFQKVHGLARDGVVGPLTRKALASPRQPRPRSARPGFHLEADLTRQVVLLVEDGKVTGILDASSGSGRPYVNEGETRVAVTPTGAFAVERKLPGWRESDLGLLYRPAYFHGGYAIHGSYSVPPAPASHGCIRVTLASMDRLYGRLPIGTPVLVYRS